MGFPYSFLIIVLRRHDRAGLVLLLLRPGVDGAPVEGHGLPGGDAPGVLALGRAAGRGGLRVYGSSGIERDRSAKRGAVLAALPLYLGCFGLSKGEDTEISVGFLRRR